MDKNGNYNGFQDTTKSGKKCDSWENYWREIGMENLPRFQRKDNSFHNYCRDVIDG